MKRLLVCILAVVFLCGCTASIDDGQSLPDQLETTNPIEAAETESIEITDTGDGVVDGEGMLPLLLIKTDIFKDRAYLLAAGKDGAVYGAEDFAYNGEPLRLSDDGAGMKDEPVTTPILESDRELQFVNTLGQRFCCYHRGITATEETAVGYVFVHAHLPEELTVSDGVYLGSYADADMFPENAVFTDEGIETDLDRNGENDKISWEYNENKAVEKHPSGYAGYLYDYKIFVERNGSVYAVQIEDSNLVVRNGLQVFAADVDGDGECELVVFETMITNSCYGAIYGWNGSAYALQQYCTVAPLP